MPFGALLRRTLVLSSIFLTAATAQAQTGPAGGSQPFSTFKPYLAVSQVVQAFGTYPGFGGGGSALGDSLGFVRTFAGSFAPGNDQFAQGQLLQISTNSALFSLLGTSY